MIGTVVRTSWLGLKRDRVAQGLSFVLPIIFFSIFAFVFGGMGDSGTPRVKIAVVDEDGSEASRRFVDALAADASLNVRRTRGDEANTPLDREAALRLVRNGDVPVAVIVTKGFGDSFGLFFGGDQAGVELHADTSDPIASKMTAGLLQKAAMTAAPDLMVKRGLDMFQQFGGAFTESQNKAVTDLMPMLRSLIDDDKATPADEQDKAPDTSKDRGPGFSGPVAVAFHDVLGESKRSGMIAFYAAGTAVMFLLFSMAGAGGTLLEEEENGVLERLLCSHLTMGKLLAGKWLFLTAMGCVQVFIMFAWGALVFQLELFTPMHFAGFAAMTLVTAGAAAAFGLVLATACRTRAQLGGASTVIILMMSAIGGSMFPRFMMPAVMQKVGLATFNAWALDGYQKVFWYERPVWELGPQLGVLAGLAIVFLLVARRLARRWEAV